MTALAAPPPVAERQTSNHDCGPACLASALEWAGKPITEPTVAAWMVAHGLDTSGTSANGLAAYTGSIAVQTIQSSSPMATSVPLALARGHLVICLHQCDGNARPVPVGSTGIAHWRVFYANDDDNYSTMNPWTAALETLPQSTFAVADLRSSLELNLGGITMTTAQAQMLTDLWNIFFSGYGDGGIAKWSNAEILRRMLAQLGATYGQPSTLPFKPLPNPLALAGAGGGGLTADQAAALAEIPTLLATMQRIEAALKAA